jgi:hypothetical protein
VVFYSSCNPESNIARVRHRKHIKDFLCNLYNNEGLAVEKPVAEKGKLSNQPTGAKGLRHSPSSRPSPPEDKENRSLVSWIVV